VERPVLHIAVGLRLGLAKDLERLVLGRGGEGEVARIGQQLLCLHQLIDLVLEGLIVLLGPGGRKRHSHRSGCLAALARVRLVDDDRETAPAVIAADLIEG
jgi:hypothetical protein